MFNVQIVGRETIKPSSSTPQNLRCLQLSLAAQVFAPAHVPYILYYSGDETAGKSNRLKKSLSEVLTRFYPLAGRIKQVDDDASLAYSHIDCNDEGVEFFEAQVDGSLSEFLQLPLIDEPSPLLPYSAVSAIIPLAVQLSVFDCGGFAIGVLISHIVVDGASLFMFITSWADATNGDLKEVVYPTFEFESVLPPRRTAKNRWMQEESASPPPPEEKMMVVVKEFVFESAKIERLRERIYEGAGFFPTRVEVVSALIGRCKTRSAGEERKLVVMHPVNIRGRMEPPLSEYSFGNLVVPVFATGELYRLGYLEQGLREAIGKVKGDRIRQLLEKDVEKSALESMWNLAADDWEKRGFDLLVFTSMDRVYESDFGWGRPEKYSSGSVLPRNAVCLLHGRDGDGGMEAMVTLEKGEMAKFEQDPELLAFTSVKNSLFTRGRL